VEIHQVLVAASYGDAITNEALLLRRFLLELGPSDIFTFYESDRKLPGVRRLSEYERLRSAKSGDNVLLVHASIGQPDVLSFLMSRRERLFLRYHNITPPEFFERFDPTFAEELRLGREELRLLRPRVSLALAVSSFNAADLCALGYENAEVAPLVVDPLSLTRTPSEEPPGGLPAPGAGPVVLFVGRIAPNKAQHQLLQAFHVLKTYRRPDAHLFLVGSVRHPLYQLALNRFVGQLALTDVHFTGQVTDPQLAAIYRRADVFLCLSAHEGFCVPLLEAMAFDVPVVAWDATAVADTVGDAAFLLDSPRPALAAEAAARVLADEGLRTTLRERGRARLAAVDPQRAAQGLMDRIRSALN
jgi:glycosyltransferase involved in cell wall biosynthesis